jgi:hypothetical protein
MSVKGLLGKALLASCVVGLAGAAPAVAQDWRDTQFLSDYTKLQPVPGKQGKDFAYVAPDLEKRVTRYDSVMVDQPEVFISPDSPYKGARPEDVAAIANVIRSTTIAALEERGYKIATAPGPNVLYTKLAVTDLQIKKKKKNLLAYTPVGFVVNTGVDALRDFMEKYDVLDVALQVEVQDSKSQEVFAAAVLQRGASADATKPISFDTLVAVTNELGERFACRLDNAHATAAGRIDCSDPATRKARPQVVRE